MVVFTEVEFWPPSGRQDRPWTDDPATDALVKSAVRVSEAYGEGLQDERLDGPCSSLRFFSHPHDDDEVELQVDTGKPDSWESGIVSVPGAVARLSAYDRAHLVLDLIHDAVLQLAPLRGWSLDAVERVHARVLAQNAEFEWASPWKASPDRSMEARVVFRIADDGFGRATLEARDRRTTALVARSAPAPSFGSLVAFKRIARTLRWKNRRIEFVPRPDTSHGEEVVSMDPDLGELHPEMSLAGDRSRVGAPVPAIVRSVYGSHLVDRTPGVVLFMGFGAGLLVGSLPDVDGTYFPDRIELEIFDRIGSGEAGIGDWLDGLPIEITLEYHLPAHVEGFGVYGLQLRRTPKRLKITILREPFWTAGEVARPSAARQEVSHLVDQVMTAVAARAHKSRRRKAR